MEREKAMKNRIHTVIFDLDGTLSNSAIITMAAFKAVVPAYGLPVPTKEAVQKATGYPNPEFYYLLFPDHPKEKINEIGELVEQEELKVLPAVSHELLFDGCRELLERLAESGIRLRIASTGDEGHVVSVLRETGIIDYFDMLCYEQPDKVKMLRDMTQDGEKDGFVMIGDMKKDYEGARANGILSVGVCYGYCIKESTDFDIYIDSPMELLDVLNIQ